VISQHNYEKEYALVFNTHVLDSEGTMTHLFDEDSGASPMADPSLMLYMHCTIFIIIHAKDKH